MYFAIFTLYFDILPFNAFAVCIPPREVANGYVTPLKNSLRPGEFLDITCDPGYRATRAVSQTIRLYCRSNGAFSTTRYGPFEPITPECHKGSPVLFIYLLHNELQPQINASSSKHCMKSSPCLYGAEYRNCRTSSRKKQTWVALHSYGHLPGRSRYETAQIA